MKTLYRYEIEYSNVDDPDTSIYLSTYQVVRETEHTYFIKTHRFDVKEKRVKKNATNTFAFDTREKAQEHFIRRTRKRIGWYKYWLKECEKALEIIENEGFK